MGARISGNGLKWERAEVGMALSKREWLSVGVQCAGASVLSVRQRKWENWCLTGTGRKGHGRVVSS